MLLPFYIGQAAFADMAVNRAEEKASPRRERRAKVCCSVALEREGRPDIMIVVGGVIPPQDFEALRESGAAAIFPPGTPVPEAAERVSKIIWPAVVCITAANASVGMRSLPRAR